VDGARLKGLERHFSGLVGADPFDSSARHRAKRKARPVLTSERTAGASDQISPSIGHLIRPTWAEVDEARERYDIDARRLRVWRWWFVGMFTFYTTLVGILLLRIFLG